MKLFWSNREGKTPPAEASFSWRPFCPRGNASDFLNFPNSGEPIERVKALPAAPSLPLRVLRKRFLPEKAEWVSSLQKVLKAMEKKQVEKVVLARSCILECESPIDPFSVASFLQKRRENATLFCLAKPGFAFLGATPEYLFTREKNVVLSEAMAGTRRRGKTPEEDRKARQELFYGDKEGRELVSVKGFLDVSLQPFFDFGPILSTHRIHTTHALHHLTCEVQGVLRGGVTDEAILDAIHPTPAVCGFPRVEAFRWIQRCEPFARGLYGGVLGWSTPKSSEWIVGIRSCQIQGSIVTLYSGAGIVAGSDPEKEWEELDAKLSLYEGLFL